MMNGLNNRKEENMILPVTSIPAVKGYVDEEDQENFFKIDKDNWDDDFNTQYSTPQKDQPRQVLSNDSPLSPIQDEYNHFSNSFASDEI